MPKDLGKYTPHPAPRVSNPAMLELHRVSRVSNPVMLGLHRVSRVSNPEMLGSTSTTQSVEPRNTACTPVQAVSNIISGIIHRTYDHTKTDTPIYICSTVRQCHGVPESRVFYCGGVTLLFLRMKQLAAVQPRSTRSGARSS